MTPQSLDNFPKEINAPKTDWECLKWFFIAPKSLYEYSDNLSYFANLAQCLRIYIKYLIPLFIYFNILFGFLAFSYHLDFLKTPIYSFIEGEVLKHNLYANRVFFNKEVLDASILAISQVQNILSYFYMGSFCFLAINIFLGSNLLTKIGLSLVYICMGIQFNEYVFIIVLLSATLQYLRGLPPSSYILQGLPNMISNLFNSKT